MEAVVAVGLASNIVQFVQVAISIGKTARDLRKSSFGLPGPAKRLHDCAQLVRGDIDKVVRNGIVDNGLKLYTDDLQQRIDAYVTACDATILKKSGGWIDSLSLAYKIWRKKDELEELVRAVNEVGNQVTKHIINDCLQRIDSKLDNLSAQAEQSESHLSEKMKDLKQQIQALDRDGGEAKSLLLAVSEWSQKDEMRRMRRGCLRSLYFQDIDDRTSAVTSAHESTFKWIFDDTVATEGSPSDTNEGIFIEWLQSEDAPKNWFWISGKPGFGKSVIMKYLSKHPSLQDRVKVWSQNRDIVIAHYFFWRFGSVLQRSIEGLFRTLLYRVLWQRQDLITKVFPKQEWSMIGPSYKFSNDDLSSGLKRLLELGDQHGICFLLFIDGLDELGSDDQKHDLSVETDILQPLRALYGYSTTKICVSSRPLGGFRDEFARNKRRCFYMEDLTRTDIEVYVQDKFSENTIFQELSASNDGYHELPLEIVEAAEGVFLWVHLATRSLLDGVMDRDSLFELKRKLQALPRTLEALYDYIMESIYRKDHRLILTALYCLKNLNLKRHYLAFYLSIDQPGSKQIPMAQNGILERLSRDLELLRERMIRQSKGLLVIDLPPVVTAERQQRIDYLVSCEIKVTHRTFLEYLRKHELQSKIYTELSSKVSAQVLTSVALQKSLFRSINDFIQSLFYLLDDQQSNDSCTSSHMTPVMNFVKNVYNQLHFGSIYVVCEQENPYLSYWGEMQRTLRRWVEQTRYRHSYFFADAVLRPFWHEPAKEATEDGWHQVLIAADAVLKGSYPLPREMENLTDESSKLQLLVHCMSYGIYLGLWPIVKSAAEFGLDPNQFRHQYGTSFWAALIQMIYSARWKELEYGARDAILSFLKHGADVTTTFDLYYHSDGKPPKFDYFGRVRTDLEDREEGDKVTFNIADGVWHIFATSNVDIEKYLPKKTDERETPQEFFVRKGIPDFLDAEVWEKYGAKVEAVYDETTKRWIYSS